jgi:magnesium transporter
MFNKRYAPPGSAPATLATLTTPKEAAKPSMRLIEYDGTSLVEKTVPSIAELPAFAEDGRIRWLDIEGLGDAALFQALGEKYGLHPLALEDAIHTGQRPKMEPYENHLFIVAQMVYRDTELQMWGEQVSMFLGRNFLVTIQEEIGTDVFDPVRARIRAGRGQIRTLGADYLCYALLDAIIDHCFPILEALGDALGDLEDDVLKRPQSSIIATLHEHKRTLAQLRRFVWPERDVCNALLHDETGLVSAQTKVFLRDACDHTVQIMDLIESYRDVISSLTEMYLVSVGMRTNEIMRVLTIMSAIFIPLTFIAGIYGMNFDAGDGTRPLNMPELYQPWGYPVVILLMLAISAGQIIFFKRKKWL